MALTPDADCEHDEFEELLGATYASSQGQLRLSAAEGPPWLWAETVEAWDDLRTALMQSYCCYVPLSLVVDLDQRLVAGYGQFFCPDQGAVPDVILECESAADVDTDPFAALLGASNASSIDPDERLGDLIARFGLIPPTEPAHEPGDCNLDQPGDA
jgi:hypothetical protein